MPACLNTSVGKVHVTVRKYHLTYPFCTGGCNTPELYWENLERGFDAIIPTPAERTSGPKVAVQTYGGFIDGFDQFDPTYFSVSLSEAAAMDPQHRLLLELVEEALADAGGIHGERAKRRTAVYVGISSNDHHLEVARKGGSSVYTATGTAHSIASGRISYRHGFGGPCYSVDTACSSSLTAFHLATRALQSGECDFAVVAAVNGIFTTDATSK
jgi:acyl transferase domain-containing protein